VVVGGDERQRLRGLIARQVGLDQCRRDALD
jgi:hypothetical protein